MSEQSLEAKRDGDSKGVLSRCDSRDLGRSAVRSGLINMGSQVVSVALGLVSTIVLARLLTPAAYGTIGMVATVIAFASLFKDLGLSTATIQRKDLTIEQVSVMFWVNVAAGLALTLVLAAASPLVAWFYNRPELVWVTVALASNVLVASLGAQHSALLTRRMRFRELAIARLSGSVATLVVAVASALAGWEHWALVAGTLAGSAVQVLLLWGFSSFRPTFILRGTGTRGMIRYGLNLTGFDLVNYFSRNLDNILIGRVLGSVSLGYYTRAYSLLLFPISNIRGPLTAVAMPALSQLQSDPSRFCAYYRRLVAILGLATMPLSAFCFVAAEPIVEVLLGPQWLPAAGIARWLAFASFLQPVAGVFGSVLIALGLANRHLRCGLAAAIVISITFVVSVRGGLETLSLAYALANYALFIPTFVYASRGTGIGLGDFFGSVWRPALAATVAGLAVLPLRSAFPPVFPILLLVVLATAYGIAYLLLFAIIPGGMRDLRMLVARVRGALGPKGFVTTTQVP